VIRMVRHSLRHHDRGGREEERRNHQSETTIHTFFSLSVDIDHTSRSQCVSTAD
jgi:hypothetical protein